MTGRWGDRFRKTIKLEMIKKSLNRLFFYILKIKDGFQKLSFTKV